MCLLYNYFLTTRIIPITGPRKFSFIIINFQIKFIIIIIIIVIVVVVITTVIAVIIKITKVTIT